MYDYHLDKGVVKDTLHLMIIISLLGNECHFINAPGEIIGYVKHSDPSEVHEELDMCCRGKSPLRTKVIPTSPDRV